MLIAPTEVDRAEGHMVAISLSPFESLVVRLGDLPALVQHYAARAYPDLKRTTLGAELGGAGAFADNRPCADSRMAVPKMTAGRDSHHQVAA
ncbi:hypothetical protein BZL29_6448 [Mycobacterium kansasii]|uniref:Uncharacterized protein n=1 Tax=Mycobacterium kansasii TaxID=1768 RepID=A0A1V3WR26_MYCKA|nr:hypothetical protein BZL29_6448 [Mycobacterium kansasii]